LDKRLAHEIAHGEKISSRAEYIWGWASPTGILRAERRSDYFIRLGDIKASDTILEVGCGTGIFTKLIHDKTKARIIAIDISDALLHKAIKNINGVEFKIENAMQMSFAGGAFDCVYGSSVLHHLELKKSLLEIYRVLKIGGRMVFAEPNMLNPQIFFQKNIPFLKKWMGDSPDERAIVRWNFKKLLQEIGFKKIKIFPYDYLHPLTPVFLIPFVNYCGRIVEKIPMIKELAGSVIIYAEK
jgi:ubiquinone/menaquinone biosynthesis C-methylase UbiE